MSVNVVREDVRRLQFYEDRADWNALTNRPSAFPPAAHSHSQADVTDLVTDLAAKQPTLVSGTTIKTVNGSSLLGAGDLVTGPELATQAEAEGGTNNTAYMTALRVVQLLAALRPAFTGSGSLTWGAIAAGASATQDITVTGAAVGDRVILGLPNSLAAGLIVNAWVQSANTVRFRITNITAGAMTPNSGAATTYSATALRF